MSVFDRSATARAAIAIQPLRPKEVAMEKIVPFLWFDDQAEEAANFYVSVFSKRPGAETSRVRNITHYGEAGEEGPCGWLKDRYGLSWQIVPVRLTELLNDPDEAAAQRVMAAMLQMTKIDIPELERAYAAGA
jgi:predicted 3-demethylubiquinone-9 3-methyltransferase (glyoxalase superfamily)